VQQFWNLSNLQFWRVWFSELDIAELDSIAGIVADREKEMVKH